VKPCDRTLTVTVELYSKLMKWEEVHKAFGAISRHDVISLNVWINTLGRMNKPEEAQAFVSQMKQTYGISPNEHHLVSLIRVLARTGKLDEAERVLDEIQRGAHQGVTISAPFFNAIIHKCMLDKDYARAKKLLKQMERGKVPFNDMAKEYFAQLQKL